MNQKDELEEYIVPKLEKLSKIKSKLNKNDQKIDKIVYKLYELSSEDIQLIETFLR